MQTDSLATPATQQPTTALQTAISAALALPVPYQDLSPQVELMGSELMGFEFFFEPSGQGQGRLVPD